MKIAPGINKKVNTVFWGHPVLLSFYIQSFHMTEYFSPERALSVRLYVCVCVCASLTAFYLKTIRPILMKLGPYDLIKNLR